jgi:hypothetical protein
MWRRARNYAQDLRSRVLAAADGEMAVRQAAALSRVSVWSIYKALIRKRATGDSGFITNRRHQPQSCRRSRRRRSPLNPERAGRHARPSAGLTSRPAAVKPLSFTLKKSLSPR